MKLRQTLTWAGVAALGVGLTTAVTITTTLLSQQPIALASEPLSAGNALVPPKARRHVTTVTRAAVHNAEPARKHAHAKAAIHPKPTTHPKPSTQAEQPAVARTATAAASPAPVPAPGPPTVAPARTVPADEGDGSKGESGRGRSDQSGRDD